ncbi:MAG: type II toxin-antitoxin system HicA family toxin [Planctomycetes bacterium]|nr:type II toxin-antitoxin system HicA family toxin [Planctomycetota bacterium]
MGKYSELRDKILAGSADGNIEFAPLCQLLVRLGFDERMKGSHHIFIRHGVAEIINLQPKGNTGKPYQVKQIRSILVRVQTGRKRCR